MANTYYKISRENVLTSFQETANGKLCKEYIESINSNMNEDLYSLLTGIHKNKLRSSELDINMLLKYYIINKLIDTPEERNKQTLTLKKTSNPNIQQDSDGNYYRMEHKSAILDRNIVKVDTDGSYHVIENRKYCQFKIVRIYNIDNQICEIFIVNANGRINSDKLQIAEILNFRQEYKTKYKYSGYSGNSKEILARVLNKFSKPMPTGYYMDANCYTWRWSCNNSSFKRIFERENELPFISDIEFKTDGTVIRQEYKGLAS